MSDWLKILKDSLDTIDSVVDAIKAITDVLPDAGALSDLAAILTDTGTTIPGTITTLQTAVTGIQNDLDNATDGLGALKALIDAVQTDATAILTDTGTTIPGTITTLQTAVTGIQNDLDNATDGLGALKALIDAAQADITAIKAVTDALPDAGALSDLAAILTDTGTTIPGTITTLQTAVTGIQNDLDNATDGLGALKALIDNLDADLVAAKVVIDDIHDTDLPAVKTVVDAITPAGPTQAQMDTAHALLATPAQVAAALATYDAPTKAEMDTGHGLLATEAKQDIIDGIVDSLLVLADSKVMGKAQIKATTEDLAQAAASYDLVTGTTQDVIIESVTLRCPVDCSDDVGAFTGISIQTDDTTAQVFIAQGDGVKANLTAQSQLAWTGAILLKATKKIQLTIYGGAADAATVCDIVVKCRAVVSGGYLA